MEISHKVGHQVLQKGTVIKSPSGNAEWVVIANEKLFWHVLVNT